MAQRDRIYRREDIVYYHELDNNNEATQDQDWMGHNQAVVSDIVISGMAPVPASDIGTTFETPVISFNDGRGDNMYIRMKKLDDDRIALLYRDTTSQGVAVVGTVSGTSSGCTMNWGTPLVFSPNVQEIGLCVLTSGRIVAVGSDLNIDDQMWAWVIDVDENNDLTIASSGDSTIDSPVFNACEVHESGFCIQYNNIAGGSSVRHRVIAGAIDESDNLVFNTSFVQIGNTRGARNTPNSNRMGYDARRRSNKVMFTFAQDHDDRPDIAIVEFKGVSGIFTMNTNGETDLDVSSGGSDVNAIMVDGTRGVASYYRLATTNLVVRPFMVSGIDITYVGPAFEVTDDAQDFEQNGHDLVRLSDSQFVIGYDQQVADEANATSGSISGTTSGDLTINFLGAQNLLPSSGGLTVKNIEGTAMDSTRIVWIIGEDADNDIWSTCGTMVIASELNAVGGGGGGGYSDTNGSTSIGVGFWSNSPTDNDSTLTVNVGQTVTFVGDTVILNNDVSWDIDSLDLNDGDTHLTLFEFTNTSGDVWELMVSIDGSGFVDFGAGLGTTSNTVSGSVSPGVSYTTSNPSGVPTSGQYVDELLVWASDGMIFDDETAANMFNLGQSGIPQGQYLNFFPSGGTSGMNMHMFGSAGQDCFLGSGNVIYYHPLDDFFEATEYIEWVGSGTFSPGQIGDANSAIAQGVNWDGSETTIESDEAHNVSVLQVDDGKYLVAYRNASTITAGSGMLRLGVASGLDTDTPTISWSSGVPFNSAGANEIRIDNLVSTETALLSWRNPFNNEDGAETIIVSGTVPEFSGNRSVFKTTSHSHVDMTVLNSGNFWVSWQEGGTGAANGRVGALDSNGTITYGTESGWLGGTIQGPGKRFLRVDDTHAVCMINGAPGKRILVGGLDGGIGSTSMQWGSPTAFVHDDVGISDQKLGPISGAKFMATYAYSVGGGTAGAESQKAYSRIFDVNTSTLDITIPSGNQDAIYAGGSDTVATLGAIGVFPTTPSRMIFWRGSNTKVGKITDGNTVWGTQTTGPTHNTVSSGPDDTRWSVPATSGSTLNVYGDTGNSDALTYSFGVLEFSANITSTFAYPAGSGNDHIATAFWARNPSSGSANVSITRDFTINVASGQIDLDGAVVWSGSAIDTLTAQLNTSSNTFVVLDFEHTSGGNWVLQTSLNGSAFTDQGSGVGTKTPASFSDIDATLMLDNPDGEDQWIDELILWAGGSGFETFTTEELGNLHSLGTTLGLEMYKYCNATFGSDEDEGEGTTEFSSIEDLIKNFNYNPQIIGRFTSMAGVSATIEVWDITNGQEQTLSLTTNVCYPIGNTGRFGWDTSNLPPMTNTSKQYFYRMTSNLAETFEGQFTVRCFNFKPEHRLRRRRR